MRVSCRPIVFASRSLKPTERNMSNYSSMKLELVALKWAVTEKFREYLLGHKCTVFTDNNPLSHLATAKLGATEQNWVSELAEFDLTLKYRASSQNANADALSRQHASDWEAEVGAGAIGVQEEIRVLPGLSSSDLCMIQHQDPQIGPFLKYWERGRMPDSKERNELAKGCRELVRQWGRLRRAALPHITPKGMVSASALITLYMTCCVLFPLSRNVSDLAICLRSHLHIIPPPIKPRAELHIF